MIKKRLIAMAVVPLVVVIAFMVPLTAPAQQEMDDFERLVSLYQTAVDDLIADYVDEFEEEIRGLRDCFNDLPRCLDHANSGRQFTDCFEDAARCASKEAEDLVELRVEFYKDFMQILKGYILLARRIEREQDFVDDDRVIDKTRLAAANGMKFAGVCD